MADPTLASGADFWASVFPTYLEAVGTIASAVVATVAVVLSIRNSSGVRNIATRINDQGASSSLETSSAPSDAGDGWSVPVGTLSTIYVADHFKWAIVNQGGTKLLVTGARVLNDGVKIGFTAPFPIELEPGAHAEYDVHRGLVGPTSAAVELTWRTEDGQTGRIELFV